MLGRYRKNGNSPLSNLRTGDSVGAKFFQNTDRILAVLASVISIVVFSYWTLRLFQLVFSGAILIALYIVAVLLSLPFWNRLSINRSSSGFIIQYRRQGVSWLVLTEAQAGGFLVFVAVYWFITNSLQNNQGILLMINSIAVICAVYVVPFIPLLSKIPQIMSFKTILVYSSSEGLDLQIHPLDQSWRKYDESELRVELEHQLQALLDSLQKEDSLVS